MTQTPTLDRPIIRLSVGPGRDNAGRQVPPAEYGCDAITDPDQFCETIKRHLKRGQEIRIYMDTMCRDPQRKGKESWPPLADASPSGDEVLDVLEQIALKIDGCSGSPKFSAEEHQDLVDVLTRAGREPIGLAKLSEEAMDPRALLASRPDPD